MSPRRNANVREPRQEVDPSKFEHLVLELQRKWERRPTRRCVTCAMPSDKAQCMTCWEAARDASLAQHEHEGEP